MVKVLDIPLWEDGLNRLVSHVLELINYDDEKRNLLISASDAHVLVRSIYDNNFAGVIRSFDLNVPDGMPSVWIGKLKGAKNMGRCYGPDFFAAMMAQTRNEPLTHFLCGGKEGVAEELKEACAVKFGNTRIVGTYSPPFREFKESDFRSLAKRINDTNSDIVWIGLSTPKQHFFAYQLSKFTDVKSIITIGAAFDFHTGRIRQAPRWIQRSGFEWLYRVGIEPRRLFRRYFKVVPLFIYYNFKEIFQKGRL